MTDLARKPAVRSIAAPFQNQSVDVQTIVETSRTASSALADFRNFTFPPLTPFTHLRQNDYYGPTTESNWVIPNVLLVGAYPATQDDEETFEILTSILKLGIKKFVCLQQEYRPGVPEELWRPGLALRPYFHDVLHIVKNKQSFSSLSGHNIVQESDLTFEHCPIVDCGITDDSKVLELSKKLVDEISRGQVIYLHCWGGHGRTGTIVSIMLHLMYGLSAVDAMHRCQVVHDLRKCPVDVGSPQTQAQRDQVTRVINRLIHEYRIPQQPRVTHLQKDPIPKKLNRPSKSMNVIYEPHPNLTRPSYYAQNTPLQSNNAEANHSAQSSQRALTKFPYFPHSSNNLNQIVGNNLVKSQQTIPSHPSTQTQRELTKSSSSSSTNNNNSNNNSAKIRRNSSTRKSIFLNEQIHENQLADIRKLDINAAVNVAVSKQELSPSGKHHRYESVSEDVVNQFVQIDISSNSEDAAGSKQNLLSSTEEVVKLPGTTATSALTSPQTSEKSVQSAQVPEPTTIAQALSNARQSVKQTEAGPGRDQQTRGIFSTNVANSFYSAKKLVPSRPANNATSGARFGVANFLNRKIEASSAASVNSTSNNPATSKAGKSNGKDFLNIF